MRKDERIEERKMGRRKKRKRRIKRERGGE